MAGHNLTLDRGIVGAIDASDAGQTYRANIFVVGIATRIVH